MSVLLETSLGDITIDLLVDEAPRCCENFLKLCKVKYYNYSPVHSIQPNFSFQSGDPLGPRSEDSDGGSSIWGLLDGGKSSSLRTFEPEFHKSLNHAERGTVSMATAPAPSHTNEDRREAASQFIITLGDKLAYLDGKAAVFGRVVEGFDTLEKINAAFIDDAGLPLKDIRIRHTIVLDEANIPDPKGLVEPSSSPIPSKAQLATVRIADDEDLDPDADQEEVEKLRRERDARAQALTLEMVGDLPFAEVAPPENVLFVCKLNPVTRDEDLELIFSRFGKILSCEVIRDKKTGDSLQYAFIEFADKKDAEMAYFKMQSVLIDDHRIHVDFSQSVSRLADVWRDATVQKRRGRRGGFGGIDGLEKKTQYRAQHEDDRANQGSTLLRATPRHEEYDLVLDRKGRHSRHGDPTRRNGDKDSRHFHDTAHKQSPRRSRSPRRDYDNNQPTSQSRDVSANHRFSNQTVSRERYRKRSDKYERHRD